MRLSPDVTAANKLKIGGICRRKGATAREKRQDVWCYLLSNEKTLGTQFIRTKQDGRLYAVLGATSEILAMPNHNRGGELMFGYLFQMYGLDRTDPLTVAIYELCRTHATNEGINADLRRFSAYDVATKTAYLSAYDGRMWRIDGAQADKVQSGEDGMFFLDDDGGLPCEPEVDNHGILLDLLTSLNYEIGPGGMTPDQQRKLMIVWTFALAFPDLLPDKPIMLLDGLKGSGKTTAIKLIQHALVGKPKIMAISKDQERDFGVLLLRSPIAILDNMDTYIDWIQDKICQYATEGTFPKRKLFSDDEEILIRPMSFVAITSRDPRSFRREDVVDRLLITRLKRYEGFKAAQKLAARIEENRPKLLGEYIYHVGRIVDALREGALDEDRIEKWRMASFASFSRVIGKVFEWPADEVEAMLEAMQAERDIFEGEGDPLVEIMQEWIVYRVRGEPPNIGREFALSELFKVFSNMAEHKGLTFYKHHNKLAERLASNYVARHFRVTSRNEETTGGKFYRIWRVTDPDLGVVEDAPIELDSGGRQIERGIVIRKIVPNG
jgi:hypothetical protein